MRRIAVDFYSKLYTAESSDSGTGLLRGLPVISEENKLSLKNDVSFEEVSRGVMGLSLAVVRECMHFQLRFTRLFGQL